MNEHQPLNADADATLQQVVAHWLPRMQVAGLPPNLIAQLIEHTRTWDNWCQTWSDKALSLERRGVHAERQGLTITAGEHYVRSSLLYHFAQFMFFNDREQKRVAAERKYTVYQSAAPYLVPKAEHLEIPYKGYSFKGYLRGASSERSNLVLIIPGTDSTKEEYGTFESYFLKRGLATFCFDGPGQGEGREFGPLNLKDWPPAVDVIIQTLRETGITGNIGLMGMELGGHLALQVSNVPGIKAIVAICGFFDMGAFWDDLPDVYKTNMHFAMGFDTIEETREQVQKFSLRDIPPPQCPVLAMHGKHDEIFPVSDAQEIAPWSQGKAEFMVFPDGLHACNNIDYLYRPMVADWLAEKLR